MDRSMPAYWLCTKHGPITGPGCLKCDSEKKPGRMHSEERSRELIAEMYRVKAMSAPTQQQLKDPAWWIREAPEWATRAGLGGAGKQPLWASVKQYQYMDSRAIYLFGCNTNLSLFDVEWVGDRPAEARPCPVCSETPCGHYNECPPGKARAERLKQLEIERDACLLEDALAEDTKPQAPEWDGEPDAYLCPAGCGCLWRDNGDETMSLYGPRSQSCEVCEPLPLDRLVPVKKLRTKEQRERDELIAVLGGNWLNSDMDQLADAIIAAGWRKGGS